MATYKIKGTCPSCKGSSLLWSNTNGILIPALESDPPKTDPYQTWTKIPCSQCNDGEIEIGSVKLKNIEDKLDEILAKLA